MMIKQNTAHFICPQMLKPVSVRVILMMYLNQSMVRLYQIYKKSLGKGLRWIVDSVVGYTINISNYKLLSGSSYIKLPKELDHPKKGLINF